MVIIKGLLIRGDVHIMVVSRHLISWVDACCFIHGPLFMGRCVMNGAVHMSCFIWLVFRTQSKKVTIIMCILKILVKY